MHPQDLACDRCWHSFFNTEAFERCCTRDHGNHKNPGIEDVTTISEIKEAGCNWCAYIGSFVSDSWIPEDQVTTSLTPVLIPFCTPAGGNIFHLSISCYSPMGKWKGGSSLLLHACTTAEDLASDHVTARPLRTDVDSDAARIQIRKWLRECKEHEYCSALQRNSILPTRVIEVSPPGRQHPRILETRSLCGIYATLSYCWGKDVFVTLSNSNHDQFAECLEIETLPLTIRDAIVTTRSLSIPYLWVDSLCIIQDSEEEKVTEIARMKEIFASSALTIVAAAAEGASKGFLYPREHQETLYTIPVRIQPSFFGTMYVNELDAVCYDERLEPISSRAWAMQEQLLSKRTLHFTTHTMTWRCSDGTKNFGNSLYFPYDLDAGLNSKDGKYSLNLHSLLLNEEEACANKEKSLSCWLRLVTAYSLRTSSLERDKLNALAGIASHPAFSHALGPGYFAGLWQYNLARQLTWRTSPWHRTLSEDDSFTFHRPMTYRAPSWSWASLDGGIIHFDHAFDEDEAVPDVICNIVDCSTIPVFPRLSPFGEILSAQMRLQGSVRWAWFKPTTSNLFMLSGSTCAMSEDKAITIQEASQRHMDDFIARYPDVNLNEDPEATHGTDYRNVYGTCDETGYRDCFLALCVAITSKKEQDDRIKGLILVKDEAESSNNVFRRIGLFERGKNVDFQRETNSELFII